MQPRADLFRRGLLSAAAAARFLARHPSDRQGNEDSAAKYLAEVAAIDFEVKRGRVVKLVAFGFNFDLSRLFVLHLAPPFASFADVFIVFAALPTAAMMRG